MGIDLAPLSSATMACRVSRAPAAMPQVPMPTMIRVAVFVRMRMLRRDSSCSFLKSSMFISFDMGSVLSLQGSGFGVQENRNAIVQTCLFLNPEP